MEEKITIIEGPTPTFEVVNDGWVLGVSDSPMFANLAVTRLRTFNGPGLVERCYRAWQNQKTIHLEYRNEEGLESTAPIVAARNLETDDGQLLLLWVRLVDDDFEMEIGYGDDSEEDQDDDTTMYL
jgi:hypothetical protein